MFPNKSPAECLSRWHKVIKPGLIKGKFSQDEDSILINAVREYGQNWSIIRKLKLSNRTPKQLRERWINYLNPEKQDLIWDTDKDKELLSKFLKCGSKWNLISKLIPGTTENLVKNRFYCLLRSTALQRIKQENSIIRKKQLEMDIVDYYFDSKPLTEEDVLKDKSIDKVKVVKQNSIHSNSKRIQYKYEDLIKYLPDLLRKYNLEEIQISVPCDIDYMTDAYRPSIKISDKDNLLHMENDLNISIDSSIKSFSNELLIHNSIPYDYLENTIGPISSEKIFEKTEKTKNYKSSILLNLQLNQIGKVLDKFNHIIKKESFESFKSKTLDNTCNDII